MLKRVLILSSLLLLLALSASAGVDQIILGGEELGSNHSEPGEIPIDNENDLYGHGQHGNGDGDNDGPLDDGGVPADPQDEPPGTETAPVPEPATGLLLGMGVLGLAKLIRRKAS